MISQAFDYCLWYVIKIYYLIYLCLYVKICIKIYYNWYRRKLLWFFFNNKNTGIDCRIEEANILAKQHGLVDVYFNLVKDVASKDECYMLAK